MRPIMNSYRSLFLLAACGVLSAAAQAQVDTSEWKCKACPFPKGVSGTVEAGLGVVTQESPKFGDITGLERKGGHAVLSGDLLYRDEGGYFADLSASDLGLDSRSLVSRSGREGLYALRLGYSELPRHLVEGASTPYLGVGSASLTLPAGYPAASTASMPLAGTLQPVDIGYTRKRLDLGGTLQAGDRWSFRVNLRRDTRDGTRATAGSFYANAAQLVLPIDQTTDNLEVSAAYAMPGLRASLGYQLSQFRTGSTALNWQNPFFPVVAGADRGQLAQAPDNQLHQFTGAADYDVLPWLRASGEFAVGRLTQDAAFLAPTLNSNLGVTLPANSLGGRVDTFNSNVRLSATPLEGLRVVGSYARDVRDNRTPIRSYDVVATDMSIDLPSRSNTPYGLKQDRWRLNADYRLLDTMKLSGGVDVDRRERNYSEVVVTRETTAWGKATLKASDDLSLVFKLSHAERDNSPYGTAVWFNYTENPLLRKYNLADRIRDKAGIRADMTVSPTIAVGMTLDYANDDYRHSLVGLKAARSVNLSGDISVALSEQTQVTAFVQGERIRSRQAGSAVSPTGADWNAFSADSTAVFGLGLRQNAIPEVLDIGGDISFSRSHSNTAVNAGASDAPFPDNSTAMDSVKLFASYKLQPNLWLNASYWFEHYDARDWHLDGVQPNTVGNLLAFGNTAPRYNINVVRVSVRYRF
jgi:MtrB/PioB family decaheme-associated outer membrane protein